MKSKSQLLAELLDVENWIESARSALDRSDIVKAQDDARIALERLEKVEQVLRSLLPKGRT